MSVATNMTRQHFVKFKITEKENTYEYFNVGKFKCLDALLYKITYIGLVEYIFYLIAT